MPKKISRHRRQRQQPGDSGKNLRSSSSVGSGINPTRKLIGGGYFALGADGIFLVTPSDEGEDRWEFVSSLLTVTAHTRDSKGENWGRLVTVVDPDGNAHELALPMEALSGEANEIISVLMNKGLRPGSGRKARELLRRYRRTR